MFANLDYPFADDGVPRARSSARRRSVLGAARRPAEPGRRCAATARSSSRPRCSASTRALGARRLLGETLPALVAGGRRRRRRTCPRPRAAATCRSARTAAIANYYGVGGYRRPLDRRAAARACGSPPSAWPSPTCPDDATLDDPRSDAGVPRDAGAAGTSPTSATTTSASSTASTRPRCARRSGALPRAVAAVSGEVMAEVFGEWRRAGVAAAAAGSCCGCATSCRAPAGACSTATARPKAAYHHLRRALAPVAVWTDRRGPRRHRRARRQRPARAAATRGCASRSTATASTRVDEASEPLALAAARRRRRATSRRCSGASSTRPTPTASARPAQDLVVARASSATTARCSRRRSASRGPPSGRRARRPRSA